MLLIHDHCSENINLTDIMYGRTFEVSFSFVLFVLNIREIWNTG
jgi:hypothetical protein